MLHELTAAWNRSALQRARELGIPEDILESEWSGLTNLRRTNAGTLVRISFADGRTPLCEATEDEWRAAIDSSKIDHPYARSRTDEWKLQQAKKRFMESRPITSERSKQIMAELEAKNEIFPEEKS